MFAGVLAAIVLVAVALMLVPITLAVERGEAGARGQLRWAFGLVAFDPFARGSRPARPDRSGSARGARRRAWWDAKRSLRLLRALLAGGRAGVLARLLRRLVRATHPQDLEVAAIIDLGDPAATGMLWATLAPVAALVRRARWGAVDVQPGFSGLGSSLRGHGHFTVVPAELVLVCLAFVCSPTTLRAVRTFVRSER